MEKRCGDLLMRDGQKSSDGAGVLGPAGFSRLWWTGTAASESSGMRRYSWKEAALGTSRGGWSGTEIEKRQWGGGG